VEIEAKFIIRDPAVFQDILKLERILDYDLMFNNEQLQRDTYFDTEDLDLLNSKSCLRLREKGRKWVVAFKAPEEYAYDIFQRQESQAEISHNELDAFLTKTVEPVQEARKIERRKNLLPVLMVTNHRQRINLLRNGEVYFEMALDEGVFNRAGRERQFMELEVEAKAGNKTSLQRIARFLTKRYELTPSRFSKYERGMALLA